MVSYPRPLHLGLAAVLLLCACSGGDGPGEPAQAGSGGGGDGTSGAGGGTADGGRAGGGAGGASGAGGAGGDAGAGAGGGAGAPGAPAACGNTSHAAGTRVHLRRAITAEGDERVLGFHDIELGIDCEFYPLEDNLARCLPSSMASYFSGGYRTYYRDAACSGVPLYGLDAECPPDYLLINEAEVGLCVAPMYRLFRRGDADTGSTASLYERRGEECRTAALEEGIALYERGEEQDLGVYAAASSGRWLEAGGLAIAGYVGEDGSRQAATYYDTARAFNCTLVMLEDRALHCLPMNRVSTYFADAACTMPLSSVHAACGEVPPAYAFDESDTVCEAYALYRVLEPYTGDDVYGTPAMCRPRTLPAVEGTVYHATEPADPSELLAVELVRDAADSGRLQGSHYRTAQGACIAAGLYDTELDTECRFGIATDGELRCLPSDVAGGVIRRFADAACTMETLYVTPDGCGNPPGFARIRETDGCSERSRILRVEPEPIALADVAPHVKLPDGTCEYVTPTGSNPYFRVGDEVPPDMLMPATVEIR